MTFAPPQPRLTSSETQNAVTLIFPFCLEPLVYVGPLTLMYVGLPYVNM